jgi:hypothetical protein
VCRGLEVTDLPNESCIRLFESSNSCLESGMVDQVSSWLLGCAGVGGSGGDSEGEAGTSRAELREMEE